jgi:xanthine dehydrogenase accessory factor
MWVAAESFHGTLGGGRFEHEVLAEARRMLAAGASAVLKEFVLCRQMGQCCGGRVEVFFEPMPRRRRVHLFGAGHVGRATAEVLSGTGLSVTVVDPRPEWCRSLPSGVRAACREPLDYARGRVWNEDDAVCVFTHSHDLDYLLVEHFLRQPLGYLGLIGSQHKSDVFRARLKNGLGVAEAEELDARWEAEVRCPIGLPIRGKEPKVIAVSIGAQLLSEFAAKPAAKKPA